MRFAVVTVAAGAATGCGLYFAPSSSSSTTADGPGSACGGSHDPPSIGAPGAPGLVSVQFTGMVVLQDADGTRTAHADRDHWLEETIRPPAMVTGVSDDGTYLETVTGVEPNDALCLGCGADPGGLKSGTVTAAAYPGATAYAFGNGEQMVPPQAARSAVWIWYGNWLHDTLAVALDDHGAALAWAAAPGQQLADGATVTLDAWHAPATFTATYDHLPADPVQLQLQRAERSSSELLPAFAFPLAQGASADTTATLTQASSDQGAPLMTVVSTALAAGGRESNTLRETVPGAATYRVDAAAAFLPWIRDVAFDPCTHVLSWTERDGAAAPDGVWVSLRWGPDASTIAGEWRVLLPPGVTRFAFPALEVGAPPWDAVHDVHLESYDVGSIQTYVEMKVTPENLFMPDNVLRSAATDQPL